MSYSQHKLKKKKRVLIKSFVIDNLQNKKSFVHLWKKKRFKNLCTWASRKPSYTTLSSLCWLNTKGKLIDGKNNMWFIEEYSSHFWNDRLYELWAIFIWNFSRRFEMLNMIWKNSEQSKWIDMIKLKKFFYVLLSWIF